MTQKIVLKLYVNGMTAAARAALENLEEVCSKYKNAHEYSIEVIDIRKHPQLAEDEKIVATPTAIKVLPLPIRRVVGDLSDHHQLLLGLDLFEV